MKEITKVGDKNSLKVISDISESKELVPFVVPDMCTLILKASGNLVQMQCFIKISKADILPDRIIIAGCIMDSIVTDLHISTGIGLQINNKLYKKFNAIIGDQYTERGSISGKYCMVYVDLS